MQSDNHLEHGQHTMDIKMYSFGGRSKKEVSLEQCEYSQTVTRIALQVTEFGC